MIKTSATSCVKCMCSGLCKQDSTVTDRCKKLRACKLNTVIYYPKCDGMVECFNSQITYVLQLL